MSALKLLDILPGYKTYIVGSIMVLAGIVGLVMPDMVTTQDPVATLLEGFAVVFLRKGIKR